MGYFIGMGGRFGRMDWWLAQLVVAAGVALTFVWFGIGFSTSELTRKAIGAHVQRTGWSVLAPFLVLAWIGVAATVKRYHDRDKSGWWVLISLIPYVGTLWQIVECGFLPGTPGANSHGSESGGDAPKTSAPAWDDDDYGYDAASIRLARIAARTPEWAATDATAAAAPAAPSEAPTRPAPVRFGRRGA